MLKILIKVYPISNDQLGSFAKNEIKPVFKIRVLGTYVTRIQLIPFFAFQ